MRALAVFAALAFAALLAGCSSPDSGPAVPGPTGSAPAAMMANATLYQFSGAVAGASPPDPNGNGPVDDQLPVAKEETFTVANGTADLAIAVEVLHATEAGRGRVEVYGPDGALAFASDTWSCTGTDAAGICLPEGSGTALSGMAPGTYTVDYLVGGQIQFSVDVTARVPAA